MRYIVITVWAVVLGNEYSTLLGWAVFCLGVVLVP